MRNVEIKARYPNLDSARSIAERLGASPTATVTQVDTYFHVRVGRLKLRENVPGRCELVFYRRPDRRGPKGSDYTVIPIAEPEKVWAVLAGALGVLAVVKKERQVLLLDNVRIHLDRVEKLGRFLEFEAVVDEEHDEAWCRAQVEELLQAFEVSEEDLVAGSYAESEALRQGVDRDAGA